jgi:hypothetical protein
MCKQNWLVLFVLAVSLQACGCGNRKPVYPVRGKVVGPVGEAAVGATVLFTRVDGDPNDKEIVNAYGVVDEWGEYKLTTYEKGDGVPEGEYVVTITWSGDEATPEPEGGLDRLQGLHDRAPTPTIHFTVKKSGSNEVDTITVSPPPINPASGGAQR